MEKENLKNPIRFLVENSIKLFGDNLVSMVLFGSRARGIYNENSDFDLIIVLEKGKDYNLPDIRKKFLINFQKRVDVHIFSKAEVIQNFNDFSPLFVTLLLGKRILFDKEMFFQNCFKAFIKKVIKNSIKYCKGENIWEMKKIAKDLEISQ